MMDLHRDQFEIEPQWRVVLSAYRDLLDSQRTNNPEHDQWLSRLNQIDGVPHEELSVAHGRLIAHGFLKFRIAGRASGMQYQLSADAARLLNCDPDSDADELHSSDNPHGEDGLTEDGLTEDDSHERDGDSQDSPEFRMAG